MAKRSSKKQRFEMLLDPIAARALQALSKQSGLAQGEVVRQLIRAAAMNDHLAQWLAFNGGK